MIKYSGKLLDAQSVQDTVGALGDDVLGGASNTKVVVHFGAGTSAGVVVVEEAGLAGYSGTWANLATINWAAASKAHSVNISGPMRAMRVRISTAIVGGTVDAYANVVQ